MMIEIISRYIEWLLTVFTYEHCSQDLKSLCKIYLPQLNEILLFDVRTKHPDYIMDDIFQKEFVHLMKIDSTIEALLLYRFERIIFVNHPGHELLGLLAAVMKIRTGMELYYSTDIGKGFNIQHGHGIVIGPRNKIGSNFIIHQGVTIGQSKLNSPHQRVIIGNNVTIFAGAKVVGNITIGDDVIIGANAVLTQDALSGSVYTGVPAEFTRRNNS